MDQSKKKTRVVVAMSGGVDSSVVAALLLRQGYDVVGITLRLWSYEAEATHGCCTPDDIYDARKVADQLGIPHYVSNMEESFHKQVVDEFLESYAIGETPNPCVQCNNTIKFDLLLKKAKELGAEYLATGHYARIQKNESGGYSLLRSVNRQKDQSYFLFGLSQEELSQTLFPLGEMDKSEVRKIAEDEKLIVANKKDSQEICFVPGSYADFVEKNLDKERITPGNIIDSSGKVLAQHEGIHQFTVGQRKGLGVQSLLPMYVVSVEESGDVMIGSKEDLSRKRFSVRDIQWVQKAPSYKEEVQVKIRSRFTPANAFIDSVEGNMTQMEFIESQESISPGQAAVIYRGEEVLGGGWIARSSA